MNAKNRTNQVGNSDLIGTPMANANLFTDFGTFSFYALGDSVRGNFGGRATRQRGPFYTDDGLVRYEDSNSPDFALRYTHEFSLGDAVFSSTPTSAPRPAHSSTPMFWLDTKAERQ